jgi:hypothetical protein
MNAVMDLSALREHHNDCLAMDMATHFAENILKRNWVRQSGRGHRSQCSYVTVSGFRIEQGNRVSYSVYLNNAQFTVRDEEQNYIKAL